MHPLHAVSGRRWLMTTVVPLIVAAGALTSPHLDASAAMALSQCNGADGAGSVVNCDVTISNTLDGAVTSSTVTVARHCAGTNVNCVETPGTTTTSTELVTAVSQCNNSGNGGGSTMTCHVRITNTLTTGSSPTPATVNQCVGSGGDGGTQPTLKCSPYPANAVNATVTQCNGSVNGGGGTERVRCTVASDATTASALPITVNQCNGSDNGGGSVITCDVAITNNILRSPAAGGATTPAGGTPAGATPSAGAMSPPGGATPGGGTTIGGSPPGGGTTIGGRTPGGSDTTTDSQPPVVGPPNAGAAPRQGGGLSGHMAALAAAAAAAGMLLVRAVRRACCRASRGGR